MLLLGQYVYFTTLKVASMTTYIYVIGRPGFYTLLPIHLDAFAAPASFFLTS